MKAAIHGGSKFSCRKRMWRPDESQIGRALKSLVSSFAHSFTHFYFISFFFVLFILSSSSSFDVLVYVCNNTGNVRNVSPTLWQFDHLTALYLNDNCLMRLPRDIGQLLNLRTLDLSNNKLRSLPAELGELIHLR